MNCVLLSLLLGVTVVTHGHPQPHLLSDEFIASINNKKPTWKAGRNFHPQPPEFLVDPPVKKPAHDLPYKIQAVNLQEIPEAFDAREAWPECASVINDIQDQGGCTSGWAVAATSAMTDRFCIKSKGALNISISTEDLNNCCDDCNYGCTGGHSVEAWYYWSIKGIATGGKYGSSNGCKAYSFPPCNHYNTTGSDLEPCHQMIYVHDCTNTCDDQSIDYESDLRTGAPYRIRKIEAEIQTEIMTNGPVEATLDVHSDFYAYKSGVYHHVSGDYRMGQGVKLIGWGVEDGSPYWLAANSWNEKWGDQGLFKVLRGTNECGIESEVYAGIPKLV